ESTVMTTYRPLLHKNRPPGGTMIMEKRDAQSLPLNYNEITGRITSLEQSSVTNKKDRENLHARVSQAEKKGVATDAKVAALAKEVADLKDKGVNNNRPGVTDPWADYRVKHGPAPGMPGPPAAGSRDPQHPDAAPRDELSEEDRRTLIVGGWVQDSKKQTILDESKPFLERDGVSNLIDQKDLIVWGP
ncbi:unnamed protein product, partial [Symbiodinium sp. CCMP2456]